MIKGSEKQTKIRKPTFLVQEYTSKQIMEQFPTRTKAEDYIKDLTIKGWFVIIKVHTIN